MSIRMNPGMSRLTVLGKGWNDNTVIDSGGGFSVDEVFWGDDDEIWNGDAFRFTVRTDLYNGEVSFRRKGRITVDWGDGTINDGVPTTQYPTVGSYTLAHHVYAENDTEYTISITGDLQDISFLPNSDFAGYTEEAYKRVTSVLTPFPATMWGAVDLGRTFYKSYLLTSIPENLFVNCPNVTNFDSAFYGCTSLTSIPAGLFDNCPNVKYFVDTFQLCKNLTSIPAGLFDNCPNVTNFHDAFYGCTSLTSIPAGLFDNCPNVKYFVDTFQLCKNLTSIPAGLFDNCPNVTNFGGIFGNCTKITSIPAGLFAHCPNVTDFGYAFYFCYELTSIPGSLFAHCPNVTDFGYAFAACEGITGALPELWNTHASANGHACFLLCDNAANYASVPEGWK